MNENELRSTLKEYVVRELLHGDGRGLDFESPLLEWGVLGSFSMVALIEFLQRSYQVEIPSDEVVPENFQNLSAISRMVLKRRGKA
jgi:acyl carrier protein